MDADEPILIALITLIIQTVLAFAMIIIAFYIHQVARNTDVIKGELVAATKKTWRAQGNIEGRQELKNEIKQEKLKG